MLKDFRCEVCDSFEECSCFCKCWLNSNCCVCGMSPNDFDYDS